MDPNQTLARLRAHMATLGDDGHSQDAYGLGATIAELFAGLDDWLVRGGALPEAWAR